MRGKNSGASGLCNKKFCPVGSDDAPSPGQKIPPKKLALEDTSVVVNPTTDLRQLVDPSDGGDYAILQQGDPATIARNRELRKQKELEKRRQEDEIRNRYQKNIVTGVPEQAKVRLIIVLRGYQNLGIDYSVVSSYFDDCFKPFEKAGNFDLDPIKDFLVFDKNALKDSASCYATALAGVQASRSNVFAPIVDIIEGLATAGGIK